MIATQRDSVTLATCTAVSASRALVTSDEGFAHVMTRSVRHRRLAKPDRAAAISADIAHPLPTLR